MKSSTNAFRSSMSESSSGYHSGGSTGTMESDLASPGSGTQIAQFQSPDTTKRLPVKDETKTDVVQVCAHCGEKPNSGNQFLKCSGCFTVYYCGKEHQRYDWKKHKMRCKVIQRQIQEAELARSEHGAKRQREVAQEETSMELSSAVPMGQTSDPVFFIPTDGAEDVEKKVANLYVSCASQTLKDHSQNLPYRTTLEDHLRACAETANKTGQHISQYQAFCMRVQRMSKFVVERLHEYGWCLIDNFLGDNHCLTIQNEVETLYHRDLFDDGQLMKTMEGNLTKDIRSDKIYWFDSRDQRAADAVAISFLISMTDSITVQLAGRIPPYNVNGRSRAMIACYPGNGTRYVKHVDNPNKDGRCLTVLYYVNKDWRSQDGGLLRIYPESAIAPVEIEPIFDRLLIFFSDKRNPHEVTPSYRHRFAITVWYFDAKEKAEAMGVNNPNKQQKQGDSQESAYQNTVKQAKSQSVSLKTNKKPTSQQRHEPMEIVPESSTADLSNVVIPHLNKFPNKRGQIFPDSDSGVGYPSFGSSGSGSLGH